MRASLVSLFVIGRTVASMAQPDSTWVQYKGGFDFREGIYLDFHSFRYNSPSYPLEELTDEQGIRIREIRGSNRFFHPDSTGERKEIDLDRAWGFCDNNVIHVHAGDGFFRIGMMGSLAHVLFEESYRDMDAAYPYGGTSVQTVQSEYILNMATGEFMRFDAAAMEKALADDEVLKPQWDEIPKKKRKQEVLYLFLRRYNDRHPLYFPR
jgi:hypothetical protein